MQSLEDYAKAIVGTFLPADAGPPASSADGNLTGQCVTLEKWIFAVFTDIPNPFAARGHARYLGINLVNQGLAVEIPAGQQIPGDTVCYEYGTYGHTGTLLAGNRLFQQNANVAGAIRRVLADGTIVYSVVIVPLWASLGGVAPKFYRLKTFKEGNSMQPTTFNQLQQMSHAVLGRTTPVTKAWYDSNPPERNWTTDQVLNAWIPSEEAKNFRFKAWDYDRLAKEFADYKANNPISTERCTPDERAYLDTMYKIVNKKG